MLLRMVRNTSSLAWDLGEALLFAFNCNKAVDEKWEAAKAAASSERLAEKEAEEEVAEPPWWAQRWADGMVRPENRPTLPNSSVVGDAPTPSADAPQSTSSPAAGQPTSRPTSIAAFCEYTDTLMNENQRLRTELTKVLAQRDNARSERDTGQPQLTVDERDYTAFALRRYADQAPISRKGLYDIADKLSPK